MKILDAGEVRKNFYGNYLNDSNVSMQLYHLIPIMQDASSNAMYYKEKRIDQHPCDAWVYQEIIYETQPEVIIELGGGEGGSALWLNDIHKNLVPSAQCIISVDIKQSQSSDGIIRIEGNSESEETINAVRKHLEFVKTVMVIDDCSHGYQNATSNLKNYGPLVTLGCYYIVEDTIINHGLIKQNFKEGDNPFSAVADYLLENDDFIIDRAREKFFVTACPSGFLRRVK